MHSTLCGENSWKIQVQNLWEQKYLNWTSYKNTGCIHTRKWRGSGTLILTPSLTGSAQKYVPRPLEWAEIKTVGYVWRQTKPNVAASRMAERGEIKLSFATIESRQCLTKCGVHFSLLFSKLSCILFAHTCKWSIMIYVPISCKMSCEWRNSFNLVDLYP